MMSNAAALPSRSAAIAATMPALAQEALLWLSEQESGVAEGAPHEFAATLRHSRSLRQCVALSRRRHPKANQTQCVYTITPTGRDVAEQLERTTPPPTGGGIYFIQGHVTGLIKIGYASNIESRLSMLQCGSPDVLLLIGCERAPRSREWELHQLFAYARAHGEWFKPTNGLLAYINDGLRVAA
jgi:hypothetical protein